MNLIINSLEVTLLAGIGWDSSTRSLIIDQDKYDSEEGAWKSKTFNIEAPSVRWELYKKFIDEMRIIGDKSTGVHILTVTSYSPDLALDWANKFYELVNYKMREKKLLKLNNNINNIERQIALTVNASLRERLYDIKSQQIKSKIIVEASPEFIFEAIGKPLTPFERTFSRRSLLVAGITTVGTVLFIFCLVLFRLFSANKEETL